MKTAYVILGNQLTRDHPAHLAKPGELIIMIEAKDLCSKLTYHKHKLILVLAAMRNYRDHLRALGLQVEYIEISESNMFLADLQTAIAKHKVTHLEWMRPSDIPPHEKLLQLCAKLKLTVAVHPNSQFLTSQGNFEDWYSSQKKPVMESFYRRQRKQLNVLMDAGKPEGGAWNYDAENRKPLPKTGMNMPKLTHVSHDKNTKTVVHVVDTLFPNNPGNSENFWLPTTFLAADAWLSAFVRTRLSQFGPYEDASKAGEAFLFHSVLSPLLNCGLLTPGAVVEAAIKAYEDGTAPLNSVEGFVRQIIGWREYMYGMYVQMPDLKQANYFGFTKELESWWYDETYQQQDLPIPVKSVLMTVHEFGYNHHIERLMVLGNWFLLNEYNPLSVYTWFSSMYVDAYEWVMVPNVQGMSQYADGGVIATKPYISGGNYLQKMGNWWPNLEAAKASDYNKLYWQFLTKHRAQLENNFRMTMVLKLAEKMEQQAH